MLKKRFVILLLTFVMVFSSCSISSDNEKRNIDQENNGNSVELLRSLASAKDENGNIDPAFSEAMQKSAFDYFSASIEDGKEKGNILISPLSLYIALAMTACGAEDGTLTQMEKVLGRIDIEDAAENISALIESLSDAHSIDLSIANSLWIRENKLNLNEDFSSVLDRYFDADSFTEPFDADTVKDINGWIEDNTNGMIKDMIGSIPADAVMYLINALAFEAEWYSDYRSTDIWESEFTEYGGNKIKTDLMYSKEDKYLSGEGVRGFIKPYKNSRFGFVALLPDEDIDVYEYASSLSGKAFREMIEGAEDAVVRTAIPQFKYEYNDSFSDELLSLGMTDAFSSYDADLNGIGTSKYGKLCISEVLHKTFIEVSAKGTKAGAATVVEIYATSASPIINPNLREVFLNRPFVYAICDLETNTPIFLGVLSTVE